MKLIGNDRNSASTTLATRATGGRLITSDRPSCRSEPALKTDEAIAIEVRKLILQIFPVAEEGIRVEVRNGVAILRGEIDDWYLRNIIEEAVAKVPNVVTVVNDILFKCENPFLIISALESIGGGVVPATIVDRR